MQAADLFEQCVIPAEVARQVGVSHQSSPTGVPRGVGLGGMACVAQVAPGGCRT
jgi:hypothetical protein